MPRVFSPLRASSFRRHSSASAFLRHVFPSYAHSVFFFFLYLVNVFPILLSLSLSLFLSLLANVSFTTFAPMLDNTRPVQCYRAIMACTASLAIMPALSDRVRMKLLDEAPSLRSRLMRIICGFSCHEDPRRRGFCYNVLRA